MRRLNVATFVNILIVGLVALTISLFVFGGRKADTLAPKSSAPVVGEIETESAFADVSLETEESPVVESEAAPESETFEAVEGDALFVDASLETEESPVVESEAAPESETSEVVDLDALFADEAEIAKEVVEADVAEPVAAAVEPDAVAEPEVAVESDAIADDVDLDALFAEETEIAVESDADAESEVAVESDAVAESEIAVESDAVAEPEAIVESEIAVESETVVEPEIAVEPEAVVESGVAVQADAVAVEAVDLAATVASDVENAENGETNVAANVRENEFWVLGQAGNGFYLYRLQNGGWVAANADEFYADADEFTTVVYAHGYQTDMNDATRDAVAFKAVLDAARRNVGAERAFRLVVWKWNSERDAARIRIDAQAKASLADWSGKALGRFLGGLGADADLALVGFSFGARVVGSALETLAQNGAQAAALDVEFDENAEFAFAVSGKIVADDVAETPAAQVASENEVENVASVETSEGRKLALILVAAACDLGSFEPRGVYGRGATLPTDVLNVYNPNDFALKYYRHVSETRSDAQGVAPLRAGVFPNAVGKTFNINSNPALGKRHSFVDALGTVPTQTIGALAF